VPLRVVGGLVVMLVIDAHSAAQMLDQKPSERLGIRTAPDARSGHLVRLADRVELDRQASRPLAPRALSVRGTYRDGLVAASEPDQCTAIVSSSSIRTTIPT
jgi:hypothetical protein